MEEDLVDFTTFFSEQDLEFMQFQLNEMQSAKEIGNLKNEMNDIVLSTPLLVKISIRP